MQRAEPRRGGDLRRCDDHAGSQPEQSRKGGSREHAGSQPELSCKVPVQGLGARPGSWLGLYRTCPKTKRVDGNKFASPGRRCPEDEQKLPHQCADQAAKFPAAIAAAAHGTGATTNSSKATNNQRLKVQGLGPGGAS